MKLLKEKYKNLILHLSQHCADKDNFGLTVLNKLLYFCDFNHYELYEKSITNESYKKLKYGPFPAHIENVIDELKKEGKLITIKTHFHAYEQIKPIPKEEASLGAFNGQEMEVIHNVLEKCSDLTAVKVSHLSHEDIPWRATKDGETINYELVFYRTPLTSASIDE